MVHCDHAGSTYYILMLLSTFSSYALYSIWVYVACIQVIYLLDVSLFLFRSISSFYVCYLCYIYFVIRFYSRFSLDTFVFGRPFVFHFNLSLLFVRLLDKGLVGRNVAVYRYCCCIL